MRTVAWVLGFIASGVLAAGCGDDSTEPADGGGGNDTGGGDTGGGGGDGGSGGEPQGGGGGDGGSGGSGGAQNGDPSNGEWQTGFGLPGLNGFGSRASAIVEAENGDLYVG